MNENLFDETKKVMEGIDTLLADDYSRAFNVTNIKHMSMEDFESHQKAIKVYDELKELLKMYARKNDEMEANINRILKLVETK